MRRAGREKVGAPPQARRKLRSWEIHPDLELSLLALQHQYRRAHHRDVRESGGKGESTSRDLIGVNYPLSRISLALSRCQSRCFSVSRLSCNFLPLATPSSSLAMPLGLKYILSGIRVIPSRNAATDNLAISDLRTKSFRVRLGS